jgi:tRNA G18 (ribose-2'-O)-methylase SpoU
MKNKQLDHYEVMSRKNEVQYKKEIVLLLDDLRLPPNIAGIFRLCDGLQVSKILLLCKEELVISKKFRAIARVHEAYLNYQVVSEDEAINEINIYKKKGFHVSALEYTSRSENLTCLEQSKKHFIIVGAEKYGIRQSFLDQAEQSIHIPMQGEISSLNVMQAVSIAIYEIRRRELTS